MEKKSSKRKKSVKEEIVAGVRSKQKVKDGATTKKSKEAPKVVEKPTAKSKKPEVSTEVKDIVKSLPKEKQAVYITASQTGAVSTMKVDMSKITATSKCIYVADIHALNPHILATIYWVIMPNTPHVVLRVTEQQYNDLLLMKGARRMKHLVTVVDNAVFPSLSYGSWSIDEINDFPTEAQIRQFDSKFKAMKLNFHNQPVIAEVAAASMEDEDELEIDFSEDDADDKDEEEEFDFS